MTRRRATIVLHWASFLLLIFLLAAGPVPWLGWAFVAASLGMGALALVFGLANGPGPKLEGSLRAVHPWFSRAMYLALAATGIVTALHLTGRWTSSVGVAEVWFDMLSASSLHAVFHLWRQTALGDGALRRITPRALHGIL